MNKICVWTDESGNSGMFDEQDFYYQAAISSTADLDEVLGGLINNLCNKLQVDRLHAHKFEYSAVAEFLTEILDCLDFFDWNFFFVSIEKRFVVSTKFVDVVFDSFDNDGVPDFWYQSRFGKHALSLSIDKLMSDDLRRKFWGAFISNNYDDFVCVMKEVKVLARKIPNKELRMVLLSGLSFAIDNFEKFTLMSGYGRNHRKPHSANLIAFSGLLHLLQELHVENGSVVDKIFHDRSDGYLKAMSEFHDIYSGVYIGGDLGGVPFNVDGGVLGEFHMVDSIDSPTLQVVDVFLWFFQKKISRERFPLLISKLESRMREFSISRETSLAVFASELRM